MPLPWLVGVMSGPVRNSAAKLVEKTGSLSPFAGSVFSSSMRVGLPPAPVRFFATSKRGGKKSRGFDKYATMKADKVPAQHAQVAVDWKKPEAASSGWKLIVLAGIGVYVAGVWIAIKFTGFKLFKTEDPASVTEEDRRRAYDCGAHSYDEEVCSGEWLMGISNLRKRLLAMANGDVLEVAAGTGHNFPLYPEQCRITATDCSAPMIEIAATKGGRRNVALQVMDAEKLAFPSKSFDTVVDTFGLCSFEEPSRSLREMQRVCRPGGRILLLEHGASSWPIVTSLLDGSSVNHAKRWGCWWNRNILGLVKASGLKIVTLERHHLGTTYWIVAEPGTPDE